MSGFDNAGVDKEFFAGANIKSNFIVALGYGTDENLYPRNPRLDFEEANTILLTGGQAGETSRENSPTSAINPCTARATSSPPFSGVA